MPLTTNSLKRSNVTAQTRERLGSHNRRNVRRNVSIQAAIITVLALPSELLNSLKTLTSLFKSFRLEI